VTNDLMRWFVNSYIAQEVGFDSRTVTFVCINMFVISLGVFNVFTKKKVRKYLQIINKYGSVTWNNDTTKHICLRRRSFKSSLVHHSLLRNVSWDQTSISYVNSSIKLNLNQSANVKLKPRKWCVFWLYVMLFVPS
jgi:hypothetical protein